MLVKIRKADGSFYTLKLLRGPKGDKGDQGEPGTGLVIRDAFDTAEALRAAHPTGEPGESYTIGDVVYTWSESLGDWKAIGSLVGPAGKDGKNGKDGSNGQNGSDGVGILSVEQTVTSTADGGENIVTITRTDGMTFEISIRNGSKGSAGAIGPAGATPTSFPASAITGTLGLAHGGTGVTSLAALKTALGISDAAGFVTGTYVGSAEVSVDTFKNISLGFEPSFVIVWNTNTRNYFPLFFYIDTDENGDNERISEQNLAFALPGYPTILYDDEDSRSVLEIVSTGFNVRNAKYSYTSAGGNDRDFYSYLNKTGQTYGYIAGK